MITSFDDLSNRRRKRGIKGMHLDVLSYIKEPEYLLKLLYNFDLSIQIGINDGGFKELVFVRPNSNHDL